MGRRADALTYLELLCRAGALTTPIYALSYTPKKGGKSKNKKHHWLCGRHVAWSFYDTATAGSNYSTDAAIRMLCVQGRILDAKEKGHVHCRRCGGYPKYSYNPL